MALKFYFETHISINCKNEQSFENLQVKRWINQDSKKRQFDGEYTGYYTYTFRENNVYQTIQKSAFADFFDKDIK